MNVTNLFILEHANTERKYRGDRGAEIEIIGQACVDVKQVIHRKAIIDIVNRIPVYIFNLRAMRMGSGRKEERGGLWKEGGKGCVVDYRIRITL